MNEQKGDQDKELYTVFGSAKNEDSIVAAEFRRATGRRRRTWLWIILPVAVIGLAFLFYWKWLAPHLAPVAKNGSVQRAVTSLPLTEQNKEELTASVAPEKISAALNESDAILRQRAAILSPLAQLGEWLKQENLIRRFVAAVDNVANGQSPASHLEFLAPKKKFRVKRQGGYIFLDPISFQRYDGMMAVFLSLKDEDCARLYRSFYPLLADAYRELGHPQGDFDQALVLAIRQVLALPAVERNFSLREKTITYAFADQQLESLSAAQKHFLRLGPKNLSQAQAKLRALASACGLNL